MPNIAYEELQNFISEGVITPFYEIRQEKLNSLTFRDVMVRKNPYLFKAKNIQTAEELVKYILDAFLSSQEETIFGELMEELAIFVCKRAFNGEKAEEGKFESIDLIFQRDGKTYIVSIKSGPNWGNSDQIKRMKVNFKEARKILKNEENTTRIVAVNGCIYGRDNRPHKVDSRDPEKSYYKFCGQEFWEFISGNAGFYQQIIVPIDKEAKKRDENFRNTYSAKINELTKEFSENFLTDEGHIDWNKLIEFVSKKKTN